jgi:ABC-type transport system involved in multi-copper enzyme maturation permease subunit
MTPLFSRLTPLNVMTQLTLKETFSDRVLYGLLVWFVAVILLANVASSLALSEDTRVFIDISYTALHFFCFLIVCFYGCFTLFKEKDRRTLSLMLSKPISKAQFILGKFLGIILLILTILVSAYVVLWGMTWVQVGTNTVSFFSLLAILNLLFLELCLLTAVAFFFSVSTSSPFICFCFTGSIYILGLYHDLMQNIPMLNLSANLKSKGLAMGLYYLSFILPNFQRFDISMALEGSISGEYLAWTNVYGLSYSVILLLFTVWIFSRKKIL